MSEIWEDFKRGLIVLTVAAVAIGIVALAICTFVPTQPLPLRIAGGIVLFVIACMMAGSEVKRRG